MQRLILNWKLPDLNKYIDDNRKSKYAAADLKKHTESLIYVCCKAQKIKPYKDEPIAVVFEWHEKDARRDLDNISFAKKFILDGLKKAKIIKDDGQRFVKGIADIFYHEPKRKESYVVVRLLTMEEADEYGVETIREVGR